MAAKGDSLTQSRRVAEKVRLGEYINEFNSRNRDGKVDSVFSVTNSKGFVSSTEYFKKEVFSKTLTTYKVVQQGDFAYNPSRINVGSIGLYDNNERGIVSPLYVTFRADAERIDFRFLLSFLKSAIALRQIRNLTAGSVRDSLKFSALRKLKLPLPTIVEQKRIAAVLDKICELKKNAEAQIEKLDLLVKSRFVEMFGDIEQGSNKFDVQSLGDICLSMCAGKDVPSDCVKVKDSNHAIPIYSNGIENNGLYGFTKEARIHLPSITISGRGTIGFVCKRMHPFVPIIRLVVATPNPDIVDLTYLESALRGRCCINTGTTIPQLPVPAARKILVMIPPLALQREFAAFVEKVDKLKDIAKKSVEQMDTLYRAKLQEYFG